MVTRAAVAATATDNQRGATELLLVSPSGTGGVGVPLSDTGAVEASAGMGVGVVPLSDTGALDACTGIGVGVPPSDTVTFDASGVGVGVPPSDIVTFVTLIDGHIKSEVKYVNSPTSPRRQGGAKGGSTERKYA